MLNILPFKSIGPTSHKLTSFISHPKHGSMNPVASQGPFNGVGYITLFIDIFYRKLIQITGYGFLRQCHSSTLLNSWDTLGNYGYGHIGLLSISIGAFCIRFTISLLFQNHQIGPRPYLGHRVLRTLASVGYQNIFPCPHDFDQE